MNQTNTVSAPRTKTYEITMTALMAAVTCILAPLSIPIGPVPISFTNLAIYLSLYLLGWKKGTISYLIYLLLGLVGLPVFSGFTGGPAKLAVIAMKLQEVFGLEDINELPIIYNIAWYEQKAVIVLLALLSLGVKNIHLGPTLPAFLSPNVTKILVNNFGIAGISSVEEDMELFFGK